MAYLCMSACTYTYIQVFGHLMDVCTVFGGQDIASQNRNLTFDVFKMSTLKAIN